MHIPGKIHIGPDTMSRREVMASLVSVLDVNEQHESWIDRELVIESIAAANMPTPNE